MQVSDLKKGHEYSSYICVQYITCIHSNSYTHIYIRRINISIGEGYARGEMALANSPAYSALWDQFLISVALSSGAGWVATPLLTVS